MRGVTLLNIKNLKLIKVIQVTFYLISVDIIFFHIIKIKWKMREI